MTSDKIKSIIRGKGLYFMEYVKWYEKEEVLHTGEGKEVTVLNLNSEKDDKVLNEWAEQFRQNYRTLEDLDFEREGTGKSREEFLLESVFPDEKKGFGPATRVGDFCELLLADYIEFIRNYYVPRTRYCRKINPNTSSQGSDVIGLKMYAPNKPSRQDEVFIIEVKGTADPDSRTKGYERLQVAIDDSKKDVNRYAESLNAMKMRLWDMGDKEKAKYVARFQNITDRPYVIKYGAAAVLTNSKFVKEDITNVSIREHEAENLELIIVHNENLKELITDLYRRAAIC